ncbi:MAG: toast rack family protein [candidate division KSB1 bacterium]|nr:toast rack family protein [candidate division KSB1 bacterium]MDZ7275766.1 toast rack family protein [candidate division KSB1 bacterium]MDZ7284543.1 toast rack family protein [candidate division KSB1 bacterium]MDZ7298038.1 toast rack family protein [candidate division KSB1 bacterium]MDZ7309089.1 toast rack family protein [candidate division KSB1 bacterium]
MQKSWAFLLLSLLLALGCRERPADREAAGDRRRTARLEKDHMVEKQTIPLTRQQSLYVDLECTAGRLELVPADSGVLAELEFAFAREQLRPTVDFDSSEVEARLQIRSPRLHRDQGDIDRLRDNHWRLKLSRQIPLTFDIEGGAFDASFDFSGMKVAGLNLDVGAGELDIAFREPNTESPNLRINSGAAAVEARGLCYANFRRLVFNGGAGKTDLIFDGSYSGEGEVDLNFGVGVNTVLLNRELGVRLRKEGSFLAPISLRAFNKRGDTYYSENFEKAAAKLFFDIKMGVGHTSIRWIE